MRITKSRIAASTFLLACSSAGAEVSVFSDESAFRNAVVDPLTVVNLDAAPLNAFTPPFLASAPGPRAAFEGMGVYFVGIDPQVFGGQDFQIAKDGRDRFFANGDGFAFYGDAVNSGNIVINMGAATAFGAWVNIGDVSTIVAYSGANRTGTKIGEAAIDSGGFGGLVSSTPFGSVEILCEQGDHKCGVYDLQFAVTAVPEPGAYLNLLAALGVFGMARRFRQSGGNRELPHVR